MGDKNTAAIGTGLVLAPFTGGLSLAVAGAGLAGMAYDYLTPDSPDIPDPIAPPPMPEPPKPEAPVEVGDEGIRKGSMLRESKKRALGQLYLTRGQERADDMTLGGYRQTLA